VALTATMVEELRAHRVKRAQDLLRLGIGLSDQLRRDALHRLARAADLSVAPTVLALA
jgi:hypothetical protein